MKNYDHKRIEKKWQKEWEIKKIYKTLDSKSAKIKKLKPYYILDMFPYPSGAGLHVGHPRGYIASDVFARLKRMEGYNVLHPMGFDSFGLPAEQYAIQTGKHPGPFTDLLVKKYKNQLSILGFSYDWSRKISTHDPKYYKWTQWIFLQIYNSYYDLSKNKAVNISNLIKSFEKNGNIDIKAWSDCNVVFTAKEWKGFSQKEKDQVLMQYRLAYEGYAEVNWCGELGTVLANDEVLDSPNGLISERDGYKVEKKRMRQWFMRITAYGDRLISGLEKLDWSDSIKEIQKNWIGKSEGSEIDFNIKNFAEKISVFTSRADTLFGVTYLVLAPEHPLVFEFLSHIENKEEVEKYVEESSKKTSEERKDNKEKTGVEMKGLVAINPISSEEIPVFIADYVLADYGTGAVMAVPAHDQRDFEFAKKYKLQIKNVISPLFKTISGFDAVQEDKPYIKRDTVISIVKHWSEEKYICLKWKKQNWRTFVVGGTDGEDISIAGAREILEETGYKNPRFKKILGYAHAQFFAVHKNENRWANVTGAYFELVDGDKETIDAKENELDEVFWMTKDEIEKNITREESLLFWNELHGKSQAITEKGFLINSSTFNNLSSEEARKKITEFVGGRFVTKYKIRDAIFARQRYWGEPIPLIHKNDGSIKEVKEIKLPLLLPNVKSYKPSGNGESPLSVVKSWTKEGYETNTMPGWAGSSWYFLRYMDPKNNKNFASKKEVDYWKNVDMYIGGTEHATGHLLYSRFWNKVLFDLGYVKEDEPFKSLRNQGMILATDGRKMSKRWGNVINPDDIVKTYGADTMRLYEMFMGPFSSSQPWNTDSIIGSRRFLEKVWRLQNKISSKQSSLDINKILHKTIKKVSEDIKGMHFNTAVSSMMILATEIDKSDFINKDDYKKFIQILSPFCPHISEELWHILGEKKSIVFSNWPKWNEDFVKDQEFKIIIQVNGKLRGEISINLDTSEEDVKEYALKLDTVVKLVGSSQPKKFIYIKNRLLNIVL